MTRDEYKDFQNKLSKGLQESFEKMLLLKKKLGQSIVTCDEKGNVITLTAQEAWNLYEKRKKEDRNINSNMSEQEYTSNRLTEKNEPTDEQLAELMHRAGDEARRSNAEANAKFFDSLREACEEAGKRAESIKI